MDEFEFPVTYKPYFKNGVRIVMKNDYIRLKHCNTKAYLSINEFSSPLTGIRNEVSASLNEYLVHYNETVWKIKMNTSGELNTHIDKFVLLNEMFNATIFVTVQSLPSWGYGQKEVSGNKNNNNKETFWSIKELNHKFTLQNKPNSGIKLMSKELTFAEKFYELFTLMIKKNSGIMSFYLRDQRQS